MQSWLNFALFLLASDAVLVKSDKGHSSFNYASPATWSKSFPTCGGKRQSPIDIDFKYYNDKEDDLPQVKWTGYDKAPSTMKIANNGHTVQVSATWPKGETPMLSGGPLKGKYVFAQLHFHWGATNKAGSEHTLEGGRYPLEMHLVHWKQSYGNMSKAVQHGDGLAVVGYLAEFGSLRFDKGGIRMMQESFGNITKSGQQKEIKPFPLTNFGMKQGDTYLTYEGSLTTPPCSESVIWMVGDDPNYVAGSEMEKFRSIVLDNHDDHNNRPVQPMNNRSLHYTA